MYTAYKKAGNGDIVKGFEKLNMLPYAAARTNVTHPVACIDCHDSQTMQLRITRPAFMEGIAALKASQGVTNYNVNTDATRKSCAATSARNATSVLLQRHGKSGWFIPGPKATRWKNILAYYDDVGHKDWAHDTSAPSSGAASGIRDVERAFHARSGVACADCHMPYERVGAHKGQRSSYPQSAVEHQPRVPDVPQMAEEEMKARVETIQNRTHDLRNHAMDALMDLIDDLKTAKAASVSTNRLAKAQDFQRKAQFYLDFVRSGKLDRFPRAPRKPRASWVSRLISRARTECTAQCDPSGRHSGEMTRGERTTRSAADAFSHCAASIKRPGFAVVVGQPLLGRALERFDGGVAHGPGLVNLQLQRPAPAAPRSAGAGCNNSPPRFARQRPLQLWRIAAGLTRARPAVQRR